METESEAIHNETTKYSDGNWVIDIFEELQKLSSIELDLRNSHPFCVCQVPDSLTLGKPEAFIPKFVGLGPYHHFRDNLTLTDDLKLGAAKRVLINLPNDKDSFQKLLTNYPSDIKDLYHLDVKSSYNNPTLFYVLTIDGLFLFAFLTLLNLHPEGFSYFLTGKLGMPLFNAKGEELTKNTLIREVFMLENQIPIHVLNHISGVSSNNNIIQPYGLSLGSVLQDFCIQHRPLFNSLELPEKPEACNHLLDLMYQLIVPPEPLLDPNQQDQPQNQKGIEFDNLSAEFVDFNNNGTTIDQEIQFKKSNLGCHRCCCSICFNILVFLGFTCFILWFIFKGIFKLVSWMILPMCRLVLKAFSVLYNLLKILASWFNPVFSAIHETLSDLEADYPSVTPYSKLVKALEKATRKQEEEEDSDDDVGTVVMIHSVTQLHRAGITVKPAEAGISSIQFDEKKCEFYLPCIKLDANSEVIMKNLVAYESLTKPNSLTFTRYIELMRAIIDTPEDVKLLVHGQIVHSELGYDAIADIFNGMGKSIRKNTKTPKLDKVIKKVNAVFDIRQKRNSVVKKYTSAKLISVVGGLVFLALTAMQTYCSLRNCSR